MVIFTKFKNALNDMTTKLAETNDDMNDMDDIDYNNLVLGEMGR